MTRIRFTLLLLLALTGFRQASAQEFVNLTNEDVRVVDALPVYNYYRELGTAYADSVYEVSIDYPEFAEMTPDEVRSLQRVLTAPLPAMPTVRQALQTERRKGTLQLSLMPLVFRDGKYQKLVSFKLSVVGRAVREAAPARVITADQRYARHSVLSDGKWVKIRIPESGFYELTPELLEEAGFTNPSKVKVYGYGGARQPEKISAAWLAANDDLSEQPTTIVNGRRIFYGVGPVNYVSELSEKRERNNYSTHGYYFLTESDTDALVYDSTLFVQQYYPLPNDYHQLYEVEDYSWYHGGRNLYDAEPFTSGTERSYQLPAVGKSGTLTVQMSYNFYSDMLVMVNGEEVGHILIDNVTTRPQGGKPGVNKVDTNRYSKAVVDTWTFAVNDILTDTTTVTLRQLWGHDMHLDYISLRCNEPRPMIDLATAALPVPEVVGTVPNQDLHAHEQADMVIIVPSNRAFLGEAERLAQLHREQDGMRVNIVVADELFNEFSSGTPDANAYRRYMKMLYDRAEREEDEPDYLLLFGDCAWDNRMVIADWKNQSPDDFLLSYESENSMSETECYLSDDYFCMLDDNEGGDMLNNLSDAAVGRFPARTVEDARTMVDKTIRYRLNEDAGDWQNTVCFMADDGNANLHMEDAEAVIDSANIASLPFRLNKIYWDAYPSESSSVGRSLPAVRRAILDQMRSGALIMDYTGHGNAGSLSHEEVLFRSDFAEKTPGGLPLWFLAACDIMPFNTQDANIGETALRNDHGGAVAVISTVHTVYAQLNRILNKYVMRNLLGTNRDDPTVYTIGEALRKAKISYFYEKRSGGTLESNKPNHRQYSLLGDPAIRLKVPSLPIAIDRLNGLDVSEGPQRLEAGSVVTVEGHVVDRPDFTGKASLTVCDVEEYVTGRNNAGETAEKDRWKPFSWWQRSTVLYNGSDSVVDGQFRFTFAVPKDITYSDNNAMLYVHAVNADKTLTAHGNFSDFSMGSGDEPLATEGGPEIYCYLNNALFQNGDLVSESPYFYAEVYDPDGINVSGSGIGHDMELIIDGKISTTYNLNSYFDYVFGDYCRGSVGYQIPALTPGEHVLIYRVWDVLNNSSFAQLSFVVDDGSGLQQAEASGVSTITTPTPAEREVYNVKGQSVSRQQGRGVYLYRTAEGTVKKKVIGRQ